MMVLTGCNSKDGIIGYRNELTLNGETYLIQRAQGGPAEVKIGEFFGVTFVTESGVELNIGFDVNGKFNGHYTIGDGSEAGTFTGVVNSDSGSGYSMLTSGTLKVKKVDDTYEFKVKGKTEAGDIVYVEYTGAIGFHLNSRPFPFMYEDEQILMWNEVQQSIQAVSTDDNKSGKFFLIDYLTDADNTVNGASVKRIQICVSYDGEDSEGTYIFDPQIEPSAYYSWQINTFEGWSKISSGTMTIKRAYNTYEIIFHVVAENGDIIAGLYRGKLKMYIIH